MENIKTGVDNIDFHLNINGKTVQNGNTNNMIFNVSQIIAYISKFCTLKKGDLIFTGTPSGVGSVTMGDKIEGYIGDNKAINFEVK